MDADLDSKKLISLSINAWRECSKVLGVVVECPYDGWIGQTQIRAIAFLPHFGSPNGIILGPIISADSEEERGVIQLAKNMGATYSLINVETYSTFSVKDFTEALNDWGYFGPDALCPSWLE